MKTLQDILSDALQELKERSGSGQQRLDSVEDLNAVVEALSSVVHRRVRELVSEALGENDTDQLRALGFLDTEIAALKTLTPSQVLRLFKRAPVPIVKLTISETLLSLCLDLLRGGTSDDEIEAALERVKPRLVLNQRSIRKH